MFSPLYAVYLFLFATALALLEIQIDGKNGWAANVPCWRPEPGSKAARWYSKVMGGKPLTGYHIAMFSFVLVILHQPFFVGVRWTMVRELEVLSIYFLIAVCWDFLWFVWNPHYGLKKFNGANVWWFRNWVGRRIPVDYFWAYGLSLLFAVAGEAVSGLPIMEGWMVLTVIFAICTALSMAVASKLVRRA